MYLKRAVSRFLGWKLPATFAPDGHIHFDHTAAGPANSWPTGTNLLTADEAEAMLRHCLELDVGKSTGLSFGEAIAALEAGEKVARAGWNGKGMWLILVPGTPAAQLREGTPYRVALDQEVCEILPHIDMWTVNASGRRAMLPGWLASQSDMLAKDWELVP